MIPNQSDNRVTMEDVAEQCSVSTATVSLVLSGDKRISPPTRKKVLAAVKQLGYRPHAAARSLALRSTRTIGLVMPEIEQHQELSIFEMTLWGIYEAAFFARERGILGDDEWVRFERMICLERDDGDKYGYWEVERFGLNVPLKDTLTPHFVAYVDDHCQ